MRSGDRADPSGPPWSGHRALPARSSVAGHRSPRKPAVTRDHEPARRADAPPDRVLSASSSSRLSIPLLRLRARKRARTPARSTRSGTKPPGRWGNVRRANAPAPQSKPVVQASRLVTQKASSVASGLGVRIRAAGPAHLRLYSHSDRLRAPTSKIARTCPRASGGLPPAAGADSHRPCPPRNHAATPRPEPTQSRIRVSVQRNAGATPLAGTEA